MSIGRILVAEDEASIRTLVSRYLQRQGFEIVTAFDGQDAIERLSAESFDALVVDIMMPRVDGFGVLEHVRAVDQALLARTVVITAYPRTALQRVGGTCRILPKPFNLDELKHAVEECLTSRFEGQSTA